MLSIRSGGGDYGPISLTPPVVSPLYDLDKSSFIDISEYIRKICVKSNFE